MTENEPKTPETLPVEEADTEATALNEAEAHDIEDFDAPDNDDPSIKDYLHSSDAPSRYLMLLSFSFAILALFCFGFLITQYIKHRHDTQKSAQVVEETIKLEASFQERLGEIRINWADAEMRADLVVECSTKAACDAIKERKAEARDVTIPVLQNSSRTDILNPSKKLLIRNRIAEELNSLKLPGRVTQVNFNDLSIEVNH